jgi:hypothetical protein
MHEFDDAAKRGTRDLREAEHRLIEPSPVTGNMKITLSASSVCVGEKASSSAARLYRLFR